MASFQNFEIGELTTGQNVIPDLAGQVVLAVNVASKCGLTPHYAGLQKLYDELSDKGFSVVGFPCNQFGEQEPGTPDDIASMVLLLCSDAGSWITGEHHLIAGGRTQRSYQYKSKQP